MMRIFFTVDTEFWPRVPEQPDFNQLDLDIQRDIYGQTHDGEFGIRYQLDALDSEGLKGVFFIEALSAMRAGVGSLQAMISLVEMRGHSVELHLHSEWLAWITHPNLPAKRATSLKDLSAEEQSLLIAQGMALFKDAGLRTPVSAFRAGNYGANFDTLRALARDGLRFDSSYNLPYLDSECGLRTPEPLLQPLRLDGILEVPITFFEDYPGHNRHVQLTAASFNEMRFALEAAHDQNWKSFVIVSHSFELIRRNCHTAGAARVDRLVVNRFHKLIKYLGANKDKYLVAGFGNVLEDELVTAAEGDGAKPLRGSLFNTSARWVEQGLRRFAN